MTLEFKCLDQIISFILSILYVFLYGALGMIVTGGPKDQNQSRSIEDRTKSDSHPSLLSAQAGITGILFLTNEFLMASPGLGAYLERCGSRFRFSGWS